ncbi:MAG: hypothetical protein Q4C96_02825 [Planctomycetia bacterium]|nr:hypothetical protein [Planctomycetia bacterium]
MSYSFYASRNVDISSVKNTLKAITFKVSVTKYVLSLVFLIFFFGCEKNPVHKTAEIPTSSESYVEKNGGITPEDIIKSLRKEPASSDISLDPQVAEAIDFIFSELFSGEASPPSLEKDIPFSEMTIYQKATYNGTSALPEPKEDEDYENNKENYVKIPAKLVEFYGEDLP